MTKKPKAPRPKDVCTFHNFPPVVDPASGEINQPWLDLIHALARDCARQDNQLQQKIRTERPNWAGVVMLGQVFDTIDDFARHFDLGPGDFTVWRYKNGKRVEVPWNPAAEGPRHK